MAPVDGGEQPCRTGCDLRLRRFLCRTLGPLAALDPLPSRRCLLWRGLFFQRSLLDDFPVDLVQEGGVMVTLNRAHLGIDDLVRNLGHSRATVGWKVG